MSESSNDISPSEDTAFEIDPPQEAKPQFGVVDIVEAFTAMRHEWRGQTKESRQLAERIEAAVAMLQNVEARMLAVEENRVAESSASAADPSMKLAQLVAETDHQLTRAVRAIEQTENYHQLREQDETEALESFFSSRSAIARWFSRPLLEFLTEQRKAREQASENSGVEGLNLVLARLRRSMKEFEIERVDTEGQQFDATIMNAIGTVESSEHPSGHVAEQLSPCYRWQGQVLRFADVRVAD